jgi:hypothetical protein
LFGDIDSLKSNAAHVLSDPEFLSKLAFIDPAKLSKEDMDAVKTITKSPGFNVNKMANANKAVVGLFKWILVIEEIYGESHLRQQMSSIAHIGSHISMLDNTH